jgi:hypothetical protein
LQSWAGLNLKTIYGGTAVIALAMSALSFVITKKAGMTALKLDSTINLINQGEKI